MLLEKSVQLPETDALSILERITDAFFALDTRWRFTYVNASAERLLHRTRAELLGNTVWEKFPEAVDSSFYTEYHRAVAEQTTVAFEAYYPPLQTHFMVHAYPSHDGLSVYFEDITERKNEETRRRQWERRSAFGAEVGAAVNQSGTLQSSLQRCAEAMVSHLDAALGRIWTLNAEVDEGVLELQASAGMYTHLNGPHGRVPVGQFKIGLIAQERKPHLTNQVVGDPRVGDQEWAKREGMVAFAGYPLLVSDQVVGVIAMFARQVLSEDTLNALSLVADMLAQTIQRKRTEEALRKSEEWLRTTLRSIGDGVITTDADTRIHFMNPVAEALTGWTREEAAGQQARDVFRIVNEHTRQEVDSPLQRAIQQGAIVGLANHTVLISRDGTERAVEDSGAPIRDGIGAVIGAVLVFRDTTERRQAEARIRTLNARLQRSMTETHHRVKNNLQLMSALIDMQRFSGNETVPMSELERLGSNVRALGVIHDILTQEAKAGSDQESLPVKAVLERLMHVLEQTTGGRPLISAFDEARLTSRQTTTLALVTNELVSNALKYGRGETEIRFRVDGNTGTLEVCDDGPGFPAGFNVETASNTGLELVESIVRWDLRGEIAFANRPNGGAQVSVSFPITPHHQE